MCPLATLGAGMVIMVAGFGGKSGMSIQAGHKPVGTRTDSGMAGSADTCTCPHEVLPHGEDTVTESPEWPQWLFLHMSKDTGAMQDIL